LSDQRNLLAERQADRRPEHRERTLSGNAADLCTNAVAGVVS
jgi:hypothetical protein